MKPGPRAVLQVIFETLELDASPRDLTDLAQEVIASQGWAVDPVEKSEEWSSQIHLLLQRHYDESVAGKRLPKVSFNSSTPTMVQGPCFMEPRDSEETKDQKRKRIRWREYYSSLKQLNPRQFELLCKGVLQLLGVKDATVTQYSGDEGIDFFGQISFAEIAGLVPKYGVFEESLRVWLVGQAKHYQRVKVATPDLRELVGAVTLGRARAFGESDELKFSDLRIRVCDPVFMLFFTTGSISDHGWNLCQKSGVVAMDGEMLAQFLADKGVGVRCDKKTGSFSDLSFRKWVNRREKTAPANL